MSICLNSKDAAHHDDDHDTVDGRNPACPNIYYMLP